MVCTLFSVKLAYGQNDGTSDVQPDATFDSSKGYSVGFRLLVEDGTSWICDDASVGAAVWVQDTSRDAEIKTGCRGMTERIILYCDDSFPAKDGQVASSGISFASGGVMNDDNSRLADLYPGDTMEVCQSIRNDGYYDVITVAPGSMTVAPEFPLLGEDEATVYLYASLFPPALSEICSKMVAYDVFSREGSGLDSESIGSYSYSKTVLEVGGVGYPQDVVAGLMSFKRPRIR